MNILKNISAITFGISTPLKVNGGTSPFTWEVLPNGAGGTISTDGVYTAPQTSNRKTVDTIRVTDSDGIPIVATTTINVLTPLGLVANIIKQGMGLQEDQVIIYNQKYDVPNDARIHISVGFLTLKPFANSSKFEEVSGVMSTIQSTNFSGIVDLDIMSRDMQAMDRKEEMLMTLNSQYSQQLQSANNFNIALLPTNFINLNSEEGPAIPYRFKTSVAIQYLVSRVTPVDYYDDFDPEEITIDE